MENKQDSASWKRQLHQDMTDATVSNYKPKRYHQRSTWACDECKLRKKKCDGNGTNQCSKCKLYGKTCTYESKTRPSQPPTQRIRDLEENVRSVRELLCRVRPSLNGAHVADIDRLLDQLRPATDVPANQSITHSTSTSVTTQHHIPLAPVSGNIDNNIALRSMLVGRGRLLQIGSKPYFHGPYSGISFICSVLEFFKDTDAEAIHPYSMELYNRSGMDLNHELSGSEDEAQLPRKSEAAAFFEIALTQNHPFLQFLDAPTIWQVLELVYNKSELSASANIQALVHAVLALGMLSDTRGHANAGCGRMTSRAAKHFLSARSLFHSAPDDMIRLQTCLCIAVYLIWTSRLSEAYTFVAVASTSAIKQGLHVTAEVITTSSKSVKSTQKQLLTTLINIDLYVSTVMGLPPLINIDTAGTALAGERELNQRHHVTQTFFGEKIGRQNLHSEPTDLPSRCCQIVSLTASVLWGLNASSLDQVGAAVTTAAVDASILRQAERDMGLWTSSVGIALSPSAQDEDSASAKFLVARRHLEILYCWSQLLTYCPFLHYLRPLARGQQLPETLSRPALTCLKIAVNTITRCDSLVQSVWQSDVYVHMLHPSNWTFIYTVFLAVVVLIFLISLHAGTSKPSEAWRKAQTGIKILMAMRCDEGGATPCLAIIQELVRQLNYTVDFDFEEMDRTTRRVCQRHLPEMNVATLPETTPGRTTADINEVIMHDNTSDFTDAQSKTDSLPATYTVDELLARARAMPMPTGSDAG